MRQKGLDVSGLETWALKFILIMQQIHTLNSAFLNAGSITSHFFHFDINFFRDVVQLSTQKFLGITIEKAVALSQVVVLNVLLQNDVALVWALTRGKAKLQKGNHPRQQLLGHWELE
jgi:hypothetical protein